MNRDVGGSCQARFILPFSQQQHYSIASQRSHYHNRNKTPATVQGARHDQQTDLLWALVRTLSFPLGRSSSSVRSGIGIGTRWFPAGHPRQWRWWHRGDSGRSLSDGGLSQGSYCRWCWHPEQPLRKGPLGDIRQTGYSKKQKYTFTRPLSCAEQAKWMNEFHNFSQWLSVGMLWLNYKAMLKSKEHVMETLLQEESVMQQTTFQHNMNTFVSLGKWDP